MTVMEISRDDFAAALNEIRPGSGQAAEMWNAWAEELEEYDCGGERRPNGMYKSAGAFRAEFLQQFTSIRNRYGDTVAGQMVSLGDVPHCLFPWEMAPAARHLASGGQLEEIPKLSIEGALEDIGGYLEMQM